MEKVERNARFAGAATIHWRAAGGVIRRARTAAAGRRRGGMGACRYAKTRDLHAPRSAVNDARELASLRGRLLPHVEELIGVLA